MLNRFRFKFTNLAYGSRHIGTMSAGDIAGAGVEPVLAWIGDASCLDPTILLRAVPSAVVEFAAVLLEDLLA